MNALLLIGALLLGYYRPFKQQDYLKVLCAPYFKFLDTTLNGGEYNHGIMMWVVAVLLPSVLVAIVYGVMLAINPLLGLVIGIGVLYLTLRFSRFGQHAERIVVALRDFNIDYARQLLREWEGAKTDHYNTNQVAIVSIETLLLRAHHGVFAPIFWFVLLGPGGALLYRLSHLLCLSQQDHPQKSQESAFYRFAPHFHGYLEWLPARLSAGAFAVVGDFEDAVYCWRTQAGQWIEASAGMILASGAGALGVRIGGYLPMQGIIEARPELGMGDEADADYLQSAIGLVWRVLLLMLGLLVLMTFAHWLGR